MLFLPRSLAMHCTMSDNRGTGRLRLKSSLQNYTGNCKENGRDGVGNTPSLHDLSEYDDLLRWSFILSSVSYEVSIHKEEGSEC